MKKKWVVVIDGPSGAGKSTVGQKLAKKLGYLYLDTGALYRCAALVAIQNGIKPKNSMKLYTCIENSKIGFKKYLGRQHVFLNGEDATEKIRTLEMGRLSSTYSSLPVVRRALLSHQRKMGNKGGIVAEGRDLGTVVFPKADLKFFMVARLKERAKRRYMELIQSAKKVSFKTVLQEVKQRDFADRKRALAPLKKAKDAIRIDTTSLTIDQVVSQMYKVYREQLSKKRL